MALSDWTFTKFEGKDGHWPLDENGEPKKPVFLKHISGSQLDIKLITGMLRAFDIPVFCSYPNDGEFGELIIGMAGPGVDIYVPEENYDDAVNILSGEGVEEIQEV